MKNFGTVLVLILTFLIVGLVSGIAIGVSMEYTRWVNTYYVEPPLEGSNCMSLWKKVKNKHYRIGSLCPNSQTVEFSDGSKVTTTIYDLPGYSFELFPEYVELIEE